MIGTPLCHVPQETAPGRAPESSACSAAAWEKVSCGVWTLGWSLYSYLFIKKFEEGNLTHDYVCHILLAMSVSQYIRVPFWSAESLRERLSLVNIDQHCKEPKGHQLVTLWRSCGLTYLDIEAVLLEQVTAIHRPATWTTRSTAAWSTTSFHVLSWVETGWRLVLFLKSHIHTHHIYIHIYIYIYIYIYIPIIKHYIYRY